MQNIFILLFCNIFLRQSAKIAAKRLYAASVGYKFFPGDLNKDFLTYQLQ